MSFHDLFIDTIPSVNQKYHLSWERVNELAQKYGDVMYFHDMQDGILILNSYDATHDLLGSRASIYSDRSQSQMIEMFVSRLFFYFDHLNRTRRSA